MTRISAGWCCVLAALLVSVPLLSAAAVGEGDSPPSRQSGALSDAATGPSFSLQTAPAAAQPSLPFPPAPTPLRVPAPTVAPPPPAPVPTLQPQPNPSGFCADALSINVVDADLTPAVQGGIDLLTEYFGCQKFRIDGSGLVIRFGAITPLFNAKVLGYADNTSTTYEIRLNPDCWGVVERWDTVVAHELGHYLGWSHNDEHPYMWLTPPPGSYAQPGDLAIVCY